MTDNKMSRRHFLASSIAATGAILLESPIGHSQAHQKPNLILFNPDQLRAESLACYGHPLVRTPNIDRLAMEGTRFDVCMSQYPVCTAARCSLFTGWYPHVAGHRTVYNLLKPSEPNLMKYLKQNGYDVYWFGKNDVLVSDRFAESATEWGFYADGPEWSGKDNPWDYNDPRYFTFLFKEGRDRRDYPDYKRVRKAVDILEQRDSDKPFCIFLPLFFPHPPYLGPKGFHHLYKPQDVPPLRPANFDGKPMFYEEIYRSRRMNRLSDADFREINAVYLGMVSYTDWLLGEILAAVEDSGHSNDTAILFFSDHGDWAGDWGLVEKWSAAMDDPVLRVPLIMRVPGGARNHVVREVVELQDLMATCLEFAGIQAEHSHFSQSLVAQLHGKSGDPNRAVFSEGGYNENERHCFEPLEWFSKDHIYYPKIWLENTKPETIARTTMIRTSDYKLVLRASGKNELYDLTNDPRELHNVYGEQQFSAMQQQLQGRMLQWYINTSDVVPFERDSRDLPGYYIE